MAEATRVVLPIGTRKGLFLLHGDETRTEWTLDGPHFLGHIAYHVVLDPRDRRTLLAATKTGHLGPAVFRSTDLGKSWAEAPGPPAFPKVPEGEEGRVVDHVFWLAPSLPSEHDVCYAGTSPPALFRSDDAGERWAPISGWNDHPSWGLWTEDGDDGTPGGSLLHSINVDARDAAHLYIGLSGGGVFESRDGGASWAPLNKGCEANFNPAPDPEFGHDPHCLRVHPLAPDVLWQQNHRGITGCSDRATPGHGWGTTCPGMSATSASRSSSTRATRPPHGCSRWTATTSGRAPARTASPPCS